MEGEENIKMEEGKGMRVGPNKAGLPCLALCSIFSTAYTHLTSRALARLRRLAVVVHKVLPQDRNCTFPLSHVFFNVRRTFRRLASDQNASGLDCYDIQLPVCVFY